MAPPSGGGGAEAPPPSSGAASSSSSSGSSTATKGTSTSTAVMGCRLDEWGEEVEGEWGGGPGARQGRGSSSLPFRPFTCATLARLMAALDGASGCTGAPSVPTPRDGERRPDESLSEGRLLPPRLRDALPIGLLGDPLEDLDPYHRDSHKTFVVINSERRLHRFSAERSLWLFGPHNAVRRVCVRLLVVPCFQRTMLALILAHLAAQLLWLHVPGTSAYEFPWIFVYIHEMGVKIVARGFFMHPFSYLRDPWNILDCSLTFIWCAFLVPYWEASGALQALRALRVVRAIQESVSASPEHKAVCGGVTAALEALCRAIPLVLLSLGVVSVVGMELYAGALTRKCVRDTPPGAALPPDDLRAFYSNPANWYLDNESGEFALCGNGTGAWHCPQGHVARAPDDEVGFLQTIMNFTCRQGFGSNPPGPQSSFDYFSDGLLTALRIATADTLSQLFSRMRRVGGPWSMTFFLPALVTLFLLTSSLLSAVVVSALERVVRLQRKLQRLQDHPHRNHDPRADTMPTPYLVPSSVSSSPTKVEEEEEEEDGDDEGPLGEGEEGEGAGGCSSPGAVTTSNSSTSESTSSGRGAVEVSAPSPSGACGHVRSLLHRLASDPRLEILMLLVLGADAVAMVSFHHGMDPGLAQKLTKADLIFACIYAGEAVLKLGALGPRIYLRDACHLFELVMAITSGLVHVVQDDALLPLLRAASTMRLVRLATLASLWRPAALLERRIRAAGWMLALVALHLAGVLCILAILATRIFRPLILQQASLSGEASPRWSMSSLSHSMLALFRTFCGRWTQPLAALSPAVSPAAAFPLFLLALVAGRFILGNLFLGALLMNPRPCRWRRGHEMALWSGSRLPEVVDWVRAKVSAFKANRRSSSSAPGAGSGLPPSSSMPDPLPDDLCTSKVASTPGVEQMELESVVVTRGGSTTQPSPPSPSVLADACPWTQGKRWACLRSAAFRLLQGCPFRTLVLLAVLLGGAVSIMDDHTLQEKMPRLHGAMDIVDAGLAAFLAVELLLRLMALGFSHLFQDPLAGLDAAVLLLSLAGLTAVRGSPGDGPLLRAARASRSLRLCRLLRVWHGCRRMGAALADALPSLLAAFLACFGCLFVYACMGVRLFGGLFQRCVDAGGSAVSHDAVPSRAACDKEGLSWQSARLTFDHFWSALLALLHVATLEGWAPVVADATDARAPGLQPIRDVNLYAFAYFALFLLLAAFLYLRLFVVALLEALLRQRGFSLETFTQAGVRQYASAMSKLEAWQPHHPPPLPTSRVGLALHDVVMSRGWEAGCLALGVVQLAPLAMASRAAHPAWADGLRFISCSMALLLCLESLARFLACPRRFFCSFLNLADAAGAVGALLEGMGTLPRMFPVATASLPTPALLRLVRVWAHAGPLLMRSRMTRSLGVSWAALSAAAPQLLAVASLLALQTVVLGSLGMALYGGGGSSSSARLATNGDSVPSVASAALKEEAEDGAPAEAPGGEEELFRTFPAAAGTLLPVLLGGVGWHRLLATLLDVSAMPRLVSLAFVLAALLPSLVLTAFVPAILLTEVVDAEDQRETGVTSRASEAFHWWWRGAVWSAAASGASTPSSGGARWQLLPASHLAPALAQLPPPLRPPGAGGRCKVAALAIPVLRGDAMHPLDAADALVLDLLQRRGHSRRQLPPRRPRPQRLLAHRRDAANYTVVSTTLLRQRQDRSARVIQVAWHKYKTFGGQYDLR